MAKITVQNTEITVSDVNGEATTVTKAKENSAGA